MNKLKSLNVVRNILIGISAVLIGYSIFIHYFPQYALTHREIQFTEAVSNDIGKQKQICGVVVTYKAGISSIRSVMNIKERFSFGEIKFYSGNIGSCDVVVALCEDGKINATMAATTLLTKFNAINLVLINTGTSLSKGLKTNSIVVANNIYQFDCKDMHEKDFGISSINGTQVMKIHMDSNERDFVFIKVQEVIENAIIGNIATGDLKITTSQDAIKVRHALNCMVADSEAVAIASVAKNFDKAYSVVTIITSNLFSDNFDSDIVERDRNVGKMLNSIFKDRVIE